MFDFSLFSPLQLNLRIYIEDPKNFKTVSVTSLMETEEIIAEVLEKGHLEEDPTWTLFECAYDLGIGACISSIFVLSHC